MIRILKRFLILIAFIGVFVFYNNYKHEASNLLSLVIAVFALSFPAFITKQLYRLWRQRKLPKNDQIHDFPVNLLGVDRHIDSDSNWRNSKVFFGNLIGILIILIIPFLFFIFVSLVLVDISDPMCVYHLNDNNELECVMGLFSTHDLSYFRWLLTSIPFSIWFYAFLWHVYEIFVMYFVRHGWKSDYWGPGYGDIIQNVFGYTVAYLVASYLHSFGSFFVVFWFVKLIISILFIFNEFYEDLAGMPPSIPE